MENKASIKMQMGAWERWYSLISQKYTCQYKTQQLQWLHVVHKKLRGHENNACKLRF